MDEANVVGAIRNAAKRVQLKQRAAQAIKKEFEWLDKESARAPGGRTNDEFKRRIAALAQQFSSTLGGVAFNKIADKMIANRIRRKTDATRVRGFATVESYKDFHESEDTQD